MRTIIGFGLGAAVDLVQEITRSMNRFTFLSLAAALLVIPRSGECQEINSSHQPLSSDVVSVHPGNKLIWGTFHAGYSSFGVMGNAGLSFQIRNLVIGTSYYKSHICYKDEKVHPYFPATIYGDNHQTVNIYSAHLGFLIPGRIQTEFSAGVSYARFSYLQTISIEHNVTLPRIWETVIGSDYDGEVLSEQYHQTIGIPLNLSLHFHPRHVAGLDLQFGMNLNPHQTVFSAGLGIRVGRMQKKTR